MSAPLKMFLTCRSCAKTCGLVFSSLNVIPRHVRKCIQLRGLSTSSTLCSKGKRGNGSETKDTDASDLVDKELKSAATSISEKLPEDGKRIKNDLISRLRTMQFDHQDRGKSTKHKEYLSNVLSEMKTSKIGSEDPKDYFSSSRSIKQRFPPQQEQFKRVPSKRVHVDPNYKLFKGDRLGIFNIEDMKDPVEVTQVKETLWDVYEREELQVARSALAYNGFEEMVQWTEQGKVWKFPIDNEQDWELEKNTGFHEHVFLDHLTEDFPRKGPLRHFIDLVVVALSKNAFLTAQQKREHIDWFRQYFIEKEEILVETLGEDGTIGHREQKSLAAE